MDSSGFYATRDTKVISSWCVSAQHRLGGLMQSNSSWRSRFKFCYISKQVHCHPVSGFVKYFDRITFMTVKGSGHMVPTDKAAEALHMFEMFLDGMKPEQRHNGESD
jgi:hypothetical protein